MRPQVPAAVFFGWAIDVPMSLDFEPTFALAFFGAVVAVALLVQARAQASPCEPMRAHASPSAARARGNSQARAQARVAGSGAGSGCRLCRRVVPVARQCHARARHRATRRDQGGTRHR